MAKSNAVDKITLVLALVLMGVRINIIGSISITEIFILTQIPRLTIWLKESRLPYLHKISKAFIILIAVQILAEIMVGNSLANSMRGIAVMAFSLLLFLFFLEKLKNDISLIKWIPVGMLLNLLLFGDQFGFAAVDETSYFKFYTAPAVCYIVCIISLIDNAFIKKYNALFFLAAAAFSFIGGARTIGSILFCTGLLSLIYNIYGTLSLKRILPLAIVTICATQIIYSSVYVPKVVAGEWGSRQNKEQLARIGNSKNILMMLFSARSDFYISYRAFLDKPLWGHGAWAIDKGLKYTRMQKALFDVSAKKQRHIRRTETHLVPYHSVLIGIAAQNGIFALAAFLSVASIAYKVAFKATKQDSPYNAFLFYCIMSSVIIILFSPLAVFKNNVAVLFAAMFALYYNKLRDEIQAVDSNRHLQAQYPNAV